MNKNLIGERVKRDKNKIIERYASGVDVNGTIILDLADEYDVKVSTLVRKLKAWGVKTKKDDYKREHKKEIFKVDKSPELLAKIKENTLINNKKIKHVEFERSTEDQKLIDNILSRPIIG